MDVAVEQVRRGRRSSGDAVVVGTGPNGLAAALTLAQAGMRVTCFEANAHLGGGASTLPLTLPGYVHDAGSSIHPMALASPFFSSIGLGTLVDFAVPDASFAQVLPDGRAAVAYRDLDRTVAELGPDGRAYHTLMRPLVDRAHTIARDVLSIPLRLPRDVVGMVALGLGTAYQGSPLWNLGMPQGRAAALLTGVAAHAIGRHPHPVRAATGLMLTTLAHSVGWPVPRGGSQSLTHALVGLLREHGAQFVTGQRVTSLDQLPPADVVLCDTSALDMVSIVGHRVPAAYARAVGRFRYGPGISVAHFALSGDIPWRDPGLSLAPTVHLGGSRTQVAAAERTVMRGGTPHQPYILLVQPRRWDPTRAPAGHATVQAYCHVPAGCPVDMADTMTEAIERAAPGFRDLILHRTSLPATELPQVSTNFIGGDFGAGAMTLPQMIKRPVTSGRPWRTPVQGVYLCSSSTPPGPGVHGMCGHLAATVALRDLGT